MKRFSPLTVFWIILAASALLMLAFGSAQVQASPLLLTPTPIPATVPPPDVSAPPANLHALSIAVDVENSVWMNATFWSEGFLGDPEYAGLEIALEIGEEMPGFEVVTLDGAILNPADMRGEWLLVNFWASWCGPCQQELPYLLEAHEDTSTPFEILAVNVWDEGVAYTQYAQAEFPETLLSGRSSDDTPTSFGVQGIPTSILLDADGRIVAVHVGNITPTVMNFLRVLAGGETYVSAIPLPAPPSLIVEEATVLPSSPGADAPLEELTAAVDAAEQVGSATLWEGGVLGVDDGTVLAVEVGDKLPAFGLMTRDGEPFRLDLVGEPVLINFWASWCGPCIEEFPMLIARHENPDTPYLVAFLNVWDDPYNERQFLADYPDDLLVMTDAVGELPLVYGVDFIPISILVDETGVVRMIQLGPLNEPALDLAAALVTQADS